MWENIWALRHRQSEESTGLMSTTGVPSTASQWSHPELVCRDCQNADPVQSQRIRSRWGPRREHARERDTRVASGMYLQDVTARLMQPGDQDDVLACRDALQS